MMMTHKRLMMMNKRQIALAFAVVLALLVGIGVVSYQGTAVLPGTLLALLLVATTFALSRELYKRRPGGLLRPAYDEMEQMVTERTAELRQANENLLATSEQWRVTLSCISDGVIVTDPRGKLTFLNPVAESLIGWAESEAVGQDVEVVFRIVNQEAQQTVENPVARALGEGVIVGLATHKVLLGRDGTERLIEDSGAPIRDQAGGIAGAVLVFRDITERNRHEQAMREAEEHFLLLAETMPQLGWTCAPDGQCDYLNNRWMDYTGTTLEQNLGYGWLDALHPDDVPATTEAWLKSVVTGDDFEVKFRIRRADGQYRWHLTRALPLRDEARGIKKWFGVNTDIDDQVRYIEERERLLDREHTARRQAEDASRLKDEFLATVSHELRTPLNSMLGWAVQLRAGQLTPDHASRAIEIIERNVRTQKRLIEDLLDVAGIVSGKLKLDLHPIDLVSIIKAAVETSRPVAEEKGVQLRISDVGRWNEEVPMPHEINGQSAIRNPQSAIQVMGDPDRMQQVVWNLLSNAIKFTPAGGLVTVRLRRSASHVEIEVTDTGQGISPTFLPHVFDRFRQQDNTITRQQGGLGLGLTIVRHLVELHGGEVRAESDYDGKGTIFTVRLPFRTVERRAMNDERGKMEAGQDLNFDGLLTLEGLRILIADDEADAGELVASILLNTGAEVKTVAGKSEALEAIIEWKPDLLISDIGMPGSDGYELMREVRQLEQVTKRRLPAIALTAYTGTEDRIRALNAGFLMHVAKPVEPTELITVLASITGRLEK